MKQEHPIGPSLSSWTFYACVQIGLVLLFRVVCSNKVIPLQWFYFHKYQGRWRSLSVSSGSLSATDKPPFISRITYQPPAFIWDNGELPELVLHAGVTSVDALHICHWIWCTVLDQSLYPQLQGLSVKSGKCMKSARSRWQSPSSRWWSASSR